MIVGVMQVEIAIDWSQSLKDNHGLTDAEVKAVYDAYEDNHHDDADMDFNTQTGSEEFGLLTSSEAPSKDKDDHLFFADWDYSETNYNVGSHGIVSGLTKNALDYVKTAARPTCDTTFCDAFDLTPSIEVKWTFETQDQAYAFLDMIDIMRLHLSDEARGLPVLTNTPLARQ